MNNERLTSSQNTPVLNPRIENPELITASHLAQWPQVNSQDARAHFPGLIRRLLVETPQASEISIRTGDGVSLAGDDGVALFKEPTKLLPSGRLRFEFGTNKGIKEKANKDYDKSKETALPDETFVFVTPRRWQGKHDWVAERQADGLFKDVRALDADDLELWLQLAPNAHIWISERLGLHPRDAITLEKWWDDFSESTNPVLPLKLFTAGRASETEHLRSLLNGDPKLISLRSEWEDDALGFIAAALAEQDDASFDDILPIIIHSAETWERVTACPGTGTLIPLFDRPNIKCAINNGRHVVEVLDNNTARRGKNVDIKLPRLNRSEAADAFRSEGIEWRRADRLAKQARRGMPALIREIAHYSLDQRPSWSQPPLSNALAALTLAGSWVESNPGDLQIISELAGISLEDLENFISEATQGPDPAIRKVGKVLVFVSPKEAFLELDRDSSISLRLTSRWAEIAGQVLLEPDPFEELTFSQKIKAQMEGKQRTYSPILRRGLADSIALAGAINPIDHDTAHAHLIAEQIVSNILRQVTSDEDEHTWVNIVDVLPLLAEAAPDAFLSALEDDLDSGSPSISQLFQPANDSLGLGPSSKQHYLLWSLETLCWSREYLVRSIQILTRLSKYNLPNNSGNTPLRSMSTILCGRFRNTSADMQTRLQAINACHSIAPSIGLNLIKMLWTNHHSAVIPSNSPRYRDWELSNKEVSVEEWFNFVSELSSIAISWAKEDSSIMPWLIEAMTKTSPEDFNKIVDFLEAEAYSDNLDEDTRLYIFEEARNTIARHERHKSAWWAMPEKQQGRLRNLTKLFEPIDDLRRHTYLFNRQPDLTEADLSNYEEYQATLQKEQHKALNDFFDQPDGWKQLADLTKRSESPEKVGWALATYNQVDVIGIMFEWLESGNIRLQTAASSWTNCYLKDKGPSTLRKILESKDISEESRRLFVLNIPRASNFWNVLRDFPSDENLFWAEAKFLFVLKEDLNLAIETLHEKRRPWTAMNLAYGAIVISSSHEEEDLPDQALLISILNSAATQTPIPGEIQEPTSCVGRILDYLESLDTPIDEMARLEFIYLNLLTDYREPRALSQILSSDPNIFVELVCLAYRGKHEPAQRSDEVDSKAKHASSILENWTGFPGYLKDNTLDESTMHSWVKEARKQLSDLDRADIGDILIGQTFTHAPVDANDGIWPPRYVRDLIESIKNKNFDNGVYYGNINSRGVVWRGPDGRQEWILADEYRDSSMKVQAQWPRTARIFRRIAEHYEEEARRWDERAEISQDLD